MKVGSDGRASTETAGRSLPVQPGAAPPVRSEGPPAARARAALDALAERALTTNRERAQEIEAALLPLAEGGAIEEDNRLRALRAAHKIAGSAGTFGRERASRLARELERYLGDGAPIAPAALLPALTALEELHRELAEGHAVTAPAAASRRCLLVAHADADVAGRVLAAARARDWDGDRAWDAASARAALAGRRPDVVLLDVGLPPDGGMALLTELTSGDAPIPTLVLVRHDAFLDRVEATRAGARGFVDVDLAADRIVSAADALAGREEERTRVLALDDDALILDVLHALFDGTAIEVTGVTEPAEFWGALNRSQPDLLLLDVEMPGVTGLEMCRVIRADSRWASIPIIVLTGSVKAEDVTAVFAAGADDYVTKPVVGVELQARITNRLERERVRRRAAETDPETGLRTRAAFSSAYRRLAERAARVGEDVAVALLEVDGFRQITAEHGRAAGDAVVHRLASMLASSVGRDDLLGRWGGHEFVVAMAGLRRADGIARLAGVLEALRAESFDAGVDATLRASFSAAVAEGGEVGSDDVDDLYRRLSETVAAAERSGGNKVLPVGWRADRDPDVVDVLLVEDDQTLADVLLHSLQTRGLRGLHIADGQTALRRLVGEHPVSARVVLLDVDLPGLNGLDILGRLAARGVLRRSRVVMLTAHAGEAEILAALRQGAFDHVGKPFSLPVLMQRVRRALEA
jgi:diguanylate cyclase (GGDEF)-like protein